MRLRREQGRIRGAGWCFQSSNRMDQFDAFQYFLINLFLHNLVLVVLAGALGMVLGRLMFGTRKVALDQLREALKEEEDRARALGRKWKELQAHHEDLLKRVEAGDTSFSPEQERELEELRNEKAVLVERERGMAKKLEEVAARQKELEAEKGRLEAQVAEAGAEQGARAEVEKLLASMQGLEQRVVEAEDTARQELEGELGALRSENERLAAELAERGKVEPEDEEKREGLTAENERLESELEVMRQQVEELEGALKQARQPKGLPARRGSKADMETLEQRVAEAVREREQVEKASAVLRKEMRGLRNKVKAIEQQESREEELEQLLKDAEDRLSRSQATVAKESRVRASLEKRVGDLEGKLAESDSDGLAASDEPEEKDDLTRIKGIGVVLEKKLRAAGVTRLRQIAEWTDEELAEFSRKLRLRNRAERGDWRGQARALCDDE